MPDVADAGQILADASMGWVEEWLERERLPGDARSAEGVRTDNVDSDGLRGGGDTLREQTNRSFWETRADVEEDYDH